MTSGVFYYYVRMHLWHWETSLLIFAPQAIVLPASAAAAGRRPCTQCCKHLSAENLFLTFLFFGTNGALGIFVVKSRVDRIVPVPI
jgi:hypothetical protein